MALSTYTSINNNSEAIGQTVIDSAVGSAPFDRPSVFTPTTGYPTLTSTVDYGSATTPAKRAQCFEAPSFSCTIDPGLIVNG